MSSIAKSKKRSKKSRRLGPVQVLRPEQYEVLGVILESSAWSELKRRGVSG